MNTEDTYHPAVKLLRDLIRFPSLSHEESAIADFLVGYLQSRGTYTSRHANNVYFSIGDGDDCLLLNSHLDVVPPSADHPYDPFEPVVYENRVYGRGSVDAKASVAAMATAVLELAEDGWTPSGGRVVVALTACEELGRGYNGLEDVRPHLPPIRAALIGEPTNLRPCTSQKGLLMLNVHAGGRSAHAARAHLGDNAILRATRDIARLADVRFTRDHPLLGPIIVTVTTIAGGRATNVVPDRCSFSLDIRTTPAYTHDELVTTLRELLESDIEVHSDRLVPVSTQHDERIVRACVGASGAEPFGSPTMSDWIFVRDVPAVKIGPGTSDLSHTAQEHIEIAEVERAVRTYKDVVKTYFSGV